MNCRSCQGNLTTIFDLGEQYVSDFREDDSKPNKHPLTASICDKCWLVQLTFTTPSNEMYHENYGFKSGVSESIKDDLKENVEYVLKFKPEPKSWLDIASNDGQLLSNVSKEVFRVGVDPIKKYCLEAEKHADKIVNDFFHAEAVDDMRFDAITSISCFYDMDKPNDFVADVAKVLAKDGVWDIQQNYLLTTLQLGAVDNFCHEHLEYYTLLSLEPLLARHGLEVIDVQTNMVNGGSLRTLVAHKGAFPTQDTVERQRTIELDAGVSKLETYFDFGNEAKKKLTELGDLIRKLKSEGKSIAILAASTRGSTIWQAAHLGPEQIEYAVERNPEKVGRYFSAIGIPIISEEEARQRNPDYMIIGPWFFADGIIDREKEYLEKGGALIKPLPEVEIVRR